MRSLNEQLANYAAYHRDRRNIAIHSIGIPLILLGVAALLSRPRVLTEQVAISPAVLLFGLASLFYLRLDSIFGLVMIVVGVLAAAFGAWMAGQATVAWLFVSVALFVFGWILQFIGHYWEGRRPAFADDMMSLAIGPLFVAAEAAFALGLRLDVRAHIESKAGPTRWGRAAGDGAETRQLG